MSATERLKALGLTVLPTQANFIAIGFGRDAKPIHQGLLERGVIVRPVASYEMPEFLRVSVGTERENDRLAVSFLNPNSRLSRIQFRARILLARDMR